MSQARAGASASTASATSGRIPDFFIVGHHKSGTTALYEMLRRHPQIFMPELKEPRYFASDLREQFEPVRSGRLPDTLEEYLALFDRAAPEQIVGEASPSYLRSAVAARAIADVQPDARIIAILREPASFVRSFHLQLLQDRVESEADLRKAVEGEQIVRGGETFRRYSDHVRYVEQLRRFEDAFGREQMLVLIYEDFRADNRAALETVLAFLGADAPMPIETLEANPTVQVRSRRLSRFVNGFYAGRGPVRGALKSVVKAMTPERMQRGLFQDVRRRVLYAKPPPVDEAFELELRRRFKPEVLALSKFLDRDLLARWGYDDVD